MISGQPLERETTCFAATESPAECYIPILLGMQYGVHLVGWSHFVLLLEGWMIAEYAALLLALIFISGPN